MSASLTSGGPKHGTYLQWQALRGLAVGASLIAALGIPPAAAQTAKAHPAHSAIAHPAPGNEASHPHVYLMRGLLNIFSLGMDQLAAQVARNGIDATVYNHSVEESVVAAIAQKYRGGDHGPYILVGHSLGADAVMVMAQQLNEQSVPVALVVPFDGTESYAAPANVSCVVNLTQRKYAYVQAGPGFHGKLSNVDVSNDTTIDHITIDKSPRLQAMALKEILQAAHGQACRPGQNAPAVAGAKEPKENAAKDNAAKDNASKANTSASHASQGVIPANNTATAKPTDRPKNTTPAVANTAPAKTAPVKIAPAKSAAPDKSATAAARSS